MQTYDFTPLFRSTIGFDQISRLLEAAMRADENGGSYLPHNIEKTGEQSYRITMTVAGFDKDDLNIAVQESTLVVSGKAGEKDKPVRYLHRGIARRAFERRFELAEFIKVTGATLENGLLHIDLVRELPESMKPRTIEIEAKVPTKTKAIEKQAA